MKSKKKKKIITTDYVNTECVKYNKKGWFLKSFHFYHFFLLKYKTANLCIVIRIIRHSSPMIRKLTEFILIDKSICSVRTGHVGPMKVFQNLDTELYLWKIFESNLYRLTASTNKTEAKLHHRGLTDHLMSWNNLNYLEITKYDRNRRPKLSSILTNEQSGEWSIVNKSWIWLHLISLYFASKESDFVVL